MKRRIKKGKKIDVELRSFAILDGYQKCRHYEHYIIVAQNLAKCTKCGVLIVILDSK